MVAPSKERDRGRLRVPATRRTVLLLLAGVAGAIGALRLSEELSIPSLPASASRTGYGRGGYGLGKYGR
jgi:hypothetical protein